MKIERRFTTETGGAYGGIAFTTTLSEIRNPDGTVVFRNDAVEVPRGWARSQATSSPRNISPRRRPRAAEARPPKRACEFLWRHVPDHAAMADSARDARFGGETSAAQVFDRLAGAWTYWGWKGGYFTTEADARAYLDEMRHMLARQMGAPNSPQWFNTGLHWAYGIDGPGQGHFYVDPLRRPR